MTIYEVLKKMSIPAAYGFFRKDQPLPYVTYMGAGQDTFAADDTYIYTRNRYQVELYFKEKDESVEAELEALFLKYGYLYYKSDDTYIEDQDVFVIYYDV